MIPLLIERFAMNLGYARGLLEGVDESRMIAQPSPGMSHPAWLIGHLAWTADLLPLILHRGRPTLGEEWAALFSNKSRVRAESGIYPEKSRLIAALGDAHSPRRRRPGSGRPGAVREPVPGPEDAGDRADRRIGGRPPDDHPRGGSPRPALRLAEGDGPAAGRGSLMFV